MHLRHAHCRQCLPWCHSSGWRCCIWWRYTWWRQRCTWWRCTWWRWRCTWWRERYPAPQSTFYRPGGCHRKLAGRALRRGRLSTRGFGIVGVHGRAEWIASYGCVSRKCEDHIDSLLPKNPRWNKTKTNRKILGHFSLSISQILPLPLQSQWWTKSPTWAFRLARTKIYGSI